LNAHMPCFRCPEPEGWDIVHAFAQFGSAFHAEAPRGTLPKMDVLFAPDPGEEDPLFMLRDYVLRGTTLVAAAIKAARGLRALARKLGLHPKAIKQWKCIPVEQLQAVANVTGLPQHV